MVRNNTLVNYLQFMDARDVIAKEFDIPNKEGAILRRIVIEKINNEPFTVNDVLHLQGLGSPATNHALLKKLIAKKMVLSIPNKEDSRIKNLSPTEETLKLFRQLSISFKKFSEKK